MRRPTPTPFSSLASSSLPSSSLPSSSPAAAQPVSLASRRPAPPSTAPDAARLLEALLLPLRSEMSLFAFRGFLEPLRPRGVVMDDAGLCLQLSAPTAFLAGWALTHYGEDLRRRLASIVQQPVETIDITIEAGVDVAAPAALQPWSLDEVAPAPASGDAAPARSPDAAPVRSERQADVVPLRRQSTERPSRRLDPRYTFDAFVTGKGSQMAVSAGVSVADHPGARYSPLFLFGGTGLGKTHLLHSIGHEILLKHPTLRVASLSAEQWVNEFIQDAHAKRFEQFRRRYRNDIDVLLVDDIQFLAGKTQSQDEFFHTFNALSEAHKQIVVTSDRYPHEIAGLEDRLKTRFQWGLVCDVRPPDADTRRAILQRKAFDAGVVFADDILDFVSSSITTSVRALEGALTRLLAYQNITREPLSLDDVKDQLRPMLLAGAQSPVSVARVIDVTAAYYGMRARDLTGPSRQRQVTRARQIAMWLCREHLQVSYPELGRAFLRDHTTAMASVQKIEGLRSDAGVEAVLSRLTASLF